jgi:DivIVA domain-containing protein
MEWALWILATIVLGLGAVVASGRFGELGETTTDTPDPKIPLGRVTGEELRQTRFSTTVWGYSKVQVDELLHRLSQQLEERSEEVPVSPQADQVG